MLLNYDAEEDFWELNLDGKEIKPVHPKGDQSWAFIGGTDVEAEIQYFGHLMRRADSFEKTLMLKDWGQEKKGTTEDETVGWHDWLNVHEFEQAPGVGEGQGSLCHAAVHGTAELDTTEQLNKNN